jgi:hypothetical protein
VQIDFDGLAQRIIAIPGVPEREYTKLKSGVAGTVFYLESGVDDAGGGGGRGGAGGGALQRHRLSDRRAATFVTRAADYTVSADILFTQAGSSAGVLDRFSDQGGGGIDNFRGFILKLADNGSWQLLKNSRRVGVSILASGALARPAGVNAWHNLSLTIKGATLTATIDRALVASVTNSDPNYTTGIAGIEAGATDVNSAWTGTSWPIVQYRRLTVS